MRWKAVGFLLALAGMCWMMAGCAYTLGHYVPNSQFAYPNSNVKTLGPVSAKVSKTVWFGNPEFTVEDIKRVYNEALAQQQGANILINYKEDTTVITYGPIPATTVEYYIEGEAAKMDVGKQTLK